MFLDFEINHRLFEEATDTGDGAGLDLGSDPEENNEEAEGEEGEEGEGEGEEELDEDQLKQAKSLFKLLKDPGTANVVIKSLAEKAGLFENLETKKDVQEAKKDLKSIIKEKLGKDYEFLSDKLGDVFEAVLQEERQSHNAAITRIEAGNTEREVQVILDKLSRETKGESRKVETRMIDLMDKFQIGKNISTEEYIRGLYAQATAGSKSNSIKGRMADKINRNSNDVASRLHSHSDTGSTSHVVIDKNKKMSLNESVNFAMQEIEKDRQKGRK